MELSSKRSSGAIMLDGLERLLNDLVREEVFESVSDDFPMDLGES